MYKVQVIGEVKSKFKETANPNEMRKHESTIIIKPEYEEGLYKIENNNYIKVIFFFHRSKDYKLKGKRCHGKIRGVFASRSPKRPSSIGVTTVELLKRNGRELRVKGLDAIEGTPVIDIKPYAAGIDVPGEGEGTAEKLKD